jgi:hypothetical protein
MLCPVAYIILKLILICPVSYRFQQPNPQDITQKSKEFSISSTSTSGNHNNTRSSPSEPSYNNTLFPSTCMYFLNLLYGNFTYLLLTYTITAV